MNSFCRMYQALLASGSHKAAKILLENIPDDDPHVCRVLKACRETFGKSANVELKGCQETSGKSTTVELRAFLETACKSTTVESGGKKKKNKRKKRK